MSDANLPARRPDPAAADALPDPDIEPAFYQSLPLRRALAYLVDIAVIALLMGVAAVVFFVLKVLSLGLLSPILAIAFSLIPLAYHTLLIGGNRSATVGMQLLKIEVRTLDGGRPDYLLAVLQTITFYVTVALTNGLILAVPLFNRRRRCLHDYVCGTVVLNVLPRPDLTVEVAGR